jgi:outer membrane protein X
MKKLLILSMTVLTISFANAQVFNPFKVDFAFGGAIPGGGGAKGGVLFALEPKFAPMPQIAVGLRLEAAVMARAFESADGSSVSGKVAASASYLATGDYYFSNSFFRPFAGLGLGLYNQASASVDESGNSGSYTAQSGTKFGTMVRVGFELHHFRLAAEYNIVGKTTQTGTDGLGNPYSVTSTNNYIGLKIGFFVGGGRH